MKLVKRHPIPSFFCQIASRWKRISVLWPFRHSILHPPLWHDFHSQHRSVPPHWVEYGCRCCRRCASARVSARGIRCESPGSAAKKGGREKFDGWIRMNGWTKLGCIGFDRLGSDHIKFRTAIRGQESHLVGGCLTIEGSHRVQKSRYWTDFWTL